MAEEERDITPSDRGQAIPVSSVSKFVRIIVVDVREQRKEFSLEGMMKIPHSVYLGEIKTNWDFDEIEGKMCGVALDVQANGVNLVFPILKDNQVVNPKDGKPLTYDEIRQIFVKYHPDLKLVIRR